MEEYESTRYDTPDTYDTLLLKLDPTPTLEKIRHLLKNEQWDDSEKKWKPIMVGDRKLKPRMTEEGVWQFMLELYARISVDKILGNLTERKINDYVRQVGEVVLDFLWQHTDEYQIKDSDMASIFWIVIHNVDSILRRSKDALENKLVTQSSERKEIFQRRLPDMDSSGYYPQQGQRHGFFGGFRGR